MTWSDLRAVYREFMGSDADVVAEARRIGASDDDQAPYEVCLRRYEEAVDGVEALCDRIAPQVKLSKALGEPVRAKGTWFNWPQETEVGILRTALARIAGMEERTPVGEIARGALELDLSPPYGFPGAETLIEFAALPACYQTFVIMWTNLWGTRYGVETRNWDWDDPATNQYVATRLFAAQIMWRDERKWLKERKAEEAAP